MAKKRDLLSVAVWRWCHNPALGALGFQVYSDTPGWQGHIYRCLTPSAAQWLASTLNGKRTDRDKEP